MGVKHPRPRLGDAAVAKQERKRPPEFAHWLDVREAWRDLEKAVAAHEMKSSPVLDAGETLSEKLQTFMEVLDPK